MDVRHTYQGVLFVWDSDKAVTNQFKHDVNFETACEVFFDPFVLIEDASVPEERREGAIGLTEDWSMLYVVHLLRDGEAIRIVSAWPATRHERRRYEDHA